MKKIFEVLDWFGVIFILLAYFLINFEILVPKSVSYQALNIFGSCFIVISSLYKKDLQPAVLNIVWAIIALVALINIAI